MSNQYDETRADELGDESLEEIKAAQRGRAAGAPDVDEEELAESVELPGADLSDEELRVRVVPPSGDEFVCSRCFLVHHRTNLARAEGDELICRECA
ncbi:DUF4193 domain-containing protein [Carbonactinospora thermoautotrophica]|uniref:dUTPase n=1 Tax=Carbonactinospora thermoautotrophica TaxID=1469144 RepID=A0A132N279_9ACTN|nr:DUF4193 family protein [Carbonactinospora thermoautotrophica]KWW99585.1 Uncharacterized protein LI90_1221 [Carbonactinospora thermoautotrophica]KWX04030.1 dUTPase [Carbonactinospora thermoautotrophica]MCX9191843.1 DUF4193 domain-containing protein [Carbonactinospora thermoautotrophica]